MQSPDPRWTLTTDLAVGVPFALLAVAAWAIGIWWFLFPDAAFNALLRVKIIWLECKIAAMQKAEAAITRLHRRLCGLIGHDNLLHFENDGRRVVLECQTCGHLSPGWELVKSGYVASAATLWKDADRAAHPADGDSVRVWDQTQATPKESA